MVRALSPSQPALRLVQFPGPIEDAWYDALIHAGLEVAAYIPDYAYLVWGTDRAVERLEAALPLRWHGEYHGSYALHPALHRLQSQSEQRTVEPELTHIAVQLYQHAGVEASLAALHDRAVRVLRSPLTIQHLTTIGLEVRVEDLAWLATLPDVVSVEPLLAPQLLDEISDQIVAGQLTADGIRPTGPGYLAWLTSTVGLPPLPSAYPIVDITDDGIDDGDEVPNHPDFFVGGDPDASDRLVYNANWTTDPLADGAGGHGTINASIVGGYNDRSGHPYEDEDGYNYGLGINPFGRLAGSKIFGNTSGWSYPNYIDLVRRSYDLGARIISNSWGDDAAAGQYLIDDQIYDALVRDADRDTAGNQSVTVVFAAGNSGTQGAGTIGSPGNAKNVLTVGASENYRPTWTDGCGVGGTGANNASDMTSFSSRGPTQDGRVKPEIVAPGTHIVGSASQTSSYTGNYVCDTYYPSGQTLYAASSGTSHAAPAVAGAASLLHRFYQDHISGSSPSPAMVKAYLVNSARYLEGAYAGDTLPSNTQGYGTLNLGEAFDAVPRVVNDQETLLSGTGDRYVIRGQIARTDAPFRVTLAWTDAPGSTVGAAYVNNLDLTVAVNDDVYHGNVFAGEISVPGGSADARNNVESVFLPPGVDRTFSITVTATNLPGDGVPGNGDPTDQDFALICYNCSLEPSFDLTVEPQSQSICQPAPANYTVTTTAIGSFDDSIELTTLGLPSGATAAWSPSVINAGDSSVLTIGETATAAAGIYTFTVAANAAEQSQTAEVGLKLFGTAPQGVALSSPADGATNISLPVTLSWVPMWDATMYEVQVATNPQFSSLVFRTTLTETQVTVEDLAYQTPYFWRVRARNACDAGPPSATYSFTTQARPAVICRTPNLPIPDNDTGGAVDVLKMPDNDTLTHLDISLTMTHSWVGDLVVLLQHLETGQQVVLLDRPGVPATAVGCSGKDFDIILSDDAAAAVENACQSAQPAYALGASYRPHELLSVLNYGPLGGTWQLKVIDAAAQDSGTLDGWCLIPKTLAPTSLPYVRFSQSVYTSTLQSGLMPVTVTLSADPELEPVTVEYTTVGGNAIPGVHYMTTTGTLTFGVGDRMQQILVPVLGATGIRNYTTTIRLSNPRNAVLAPVDHATLVFASSTRHELYLPVIVATEPPSALNDKPLTVSRSSVK